MGKKYFKTMILCLFLNSLLIPTAMGAIERMASEVKERLRVRIETERQAATFTCRGELLCGIADLPLFYKRRNFNPAWIQTDESIILAHSLMRAIHSARQEGLQPMDYHTANLEWLLNEVNRRRSRSETVTPELLVDLELLLTDAFLLLGSHLLAGRVNPETIHTKWRVFNPEADLADMLQTSIDTKQVEGVLASLGPPHSGYHALKKALRRHRRIEASGGWPTLRDGMNWQRGDHDARISILRRRLELSGDLNPSGSRYDYIFDGALESAVRRFQYRHGLEVNGKIDDRTLQALNVPAGRRARQIELNLERWRWIPHELGRRYILVNIADFKLSVIESGKAVLVMRVVVGRDYRRTPVFSEKMKYLVINPSWNIPTKIAVEDILPKVRRNPDYLQNRQIKVYANWRRGAPEIDPQTVDWSQVRKDNFYFKFQRQPGPYNDLGRIKFMFPNKFAIYLHDTPARKLFRQSARGFSSGCIRVEKPIELAQYLLQDNPQWTRGHILKAIDDGETKTVRVRHQIPVHLLYWTAWVDNQGTLHFRDDIYGRDAPLDRALKEKPPRVLKTALNKRQILR
jgi:murein L,D-transpeptidase YcbB/YkuD